MLYPMTTATRFAQRLDGMWQFTPEVPGERHDPMQPLAVGTAVAVPGTFDVQCNLPDYCGYYWYETIFYVTPAMCAERLVVRFGAVAHHAQVYVNGRQVAMYSGGYTPFETHIGDLVQVGENRLTVRGSSILDVSTLPVADLRVTQDVNGVQHYHAEGRFDFNNAAGIHQPVWLYTTPWCYIHDIEASCTVTPEAATVQVITRAAGMPEAIRVQLLDQTGKIVAEALGTDTTFTVPDPQLWQPGAGYLYTLRVALIQDQRIVDQYDEPFGLRTVATVDGKLLVNGNILKWQDCLQTEGIPAHGLGHHPVAYATLMHALLDNGQIAYCTPWYPHSEEALRLADRLGIVVVQAAPAVGLVPTGSQDNASWAAAQTAETHREVLRALLARDKNHASVVLWSLATVAAMEKGVADAYFSPLVELVKEYDPQYRPICVTNTAEEEQQFLHVHLLD